MSQLEISPVTPTRLEPRKLDFAEFEIPQTQADFVRPEENFMRFLDQTGDFNLENAAAEWAKQREEISYQRSEREKAEKENDRVVYQAAGELANLRTEIALLRSACLATENQLSAALIENGRLQDLYDSQSVELSSTIEKLTQEEANFRRLNFGHLELCGKLQDQKYALEVIERDNAGKSDEIHDLSTQLTVAVSKLRQFQTRCAQQKMLLCERDAEIAVHRKFIEDLQHQLKPGSNFFGNRIRDPIVVDAEDFEELPPRIGKKKSARMSTGCRRRRSETPTLIIENSDEQSKEKKNKTE